MTNAPRNTRKPEDAEPAVAARAEQLVGEADELLSDAFEPGQLVPSTSRSSEGRASGLARMPSLPLLRSPSMPASTTSPLPRSPMLAPTTSRTVARLKLENCSKRSAAGKTTRARRRLWSRSLSSFRPEVGRLRPLEAVWRLFAGVAADG
jgi:hypothetical protein